MYPGDAAHTPPPRPTIAARVTLPVPMRFASTYAGCPRKRRDRKKSYQNVDMGGVVVVDKERLGRRARGRGTRTLGARPLDSHCQDITEIRRMEREKVEGGEREGDEEKGWGVSKGGRAREQRVN